MKIPENEPLAITEQILRDTRRNASDPATAGAAVEPPGSGAGGASPEAGDEAVAGDGTATAPARDPWDDPRLPWSGKPTKIDVLCWAAIVLSGVYYYALLPFRAHLIGTHPLLSVFLGGYTESIISAAAFARIGHGSLIVVILAAIPGLMKFDVVFWWAGRLWGERVIDMFGGKTKRGKRYLDRVRRWGRGFTWPAVLISPFLPLPNAIIYAIAGWTRMRLITFLALDMIGTLGWAGLMSGLGYAIGKPAVRVAKEISHYGLWVTIGLVVLVVFISVRSQRRMLREAAEARTATAEAGGNA